MRRPGRRGERRAGRGRRWSCSLPAPLPEWRDTKGDAAPLRAGCRQDPLGASARRNHWWNVPFHVTGRGTHRPSDGQVDGNPIFTVDFDFVDHRLAVYDAGRRMQRSFPLSGQSVASFYDQDTWPLCAALGVRGEHRYSHGPSILPDADRPFAEDTEHATYDPVAANRLLAGAEPGGVRAGGVAAGLSRERPARCSHFWHTSTSPTAVLSAPVDPATGRPTPSPGRAYSSEVISFGFWFGDDTFAEPALLLVHRPRARRSGRSAPLSPASATVGSRARRQPPGRACATTRPRRGRSTCRVLAFYESAYQSGAGRAGWDIAALAVPRRNHGPGPSHLTNSQSAQRSACAVVRLRCRCAPGCP
ncbi:DUF5996 family protein [Streptomyces echinatus]|uniref:DUF5996 family protein n=1 Tax=Streptomyces echinatus TaxID=67293 RepID=UPI003CD0C293